MPRQLGEKPSGACKASVELHRIYSDLQDETFSQHEACKFSYRFPFHASILIYDIIVVPSVTASNGIIRDRRRSESCI